MSLFDFVLKRKPKAETSIQNSVPNVANILATETSNIPEEEKQYYRPDSYYTATTREGTQFEKTVITFDERKKISYTSKNGLYVAEILLLECCTYGKYPNPQNGYPGHWWFEYGIRDVNAVLRTLEERGFIELTIPDNYINKLTVPVLKEILQIHNLPLSGKKQTLLKE